MSRVPDRSGCGSRVRWKSRTPTVETGGGLPESSRPHVCPGPETVPRRHGRSAPRGGARYGVGPGRPGTSQGLVVLNRGPGPRHHSRGTVHHSSVEGVSPPPRSRGPEVHPVASPFPSSSAVDAPTDPTRRQGRSLHVLLPPNYGRLPSRKCRGSTHTGSEPSCRPFSPRPEQGCNLSHSF